MHEDPLAGLPGPDRHRVVGNMDQFLRGRHPWEALDRLHERHGSVVRLWLFDQPAVAIADPDLVGQVLCGPRGSFYKAEPCKALRPILGDASPFITNGSTWSSLRGHSPLSRADFEAWSRDRSQALGDFVGLRFASLMRDQPRMRRMDRLERLVFDAFAFLVLGRPLSADSWHDFLKQIQVADLRMKTNLPVLTPRFFRARKRWRGAFTAEVERILAGEGGADAQASLVALAGRQSTLRRIDFANEMANIFPGGLFSVAGTLANALDQLAAAPDWQRAACEDAHRAHDPAESDTRPHLEGALLEAMRLFPAAPVLSRAVSPGTDFEAAGVRLPDHARVLISVSAIQRSSQHWLDAHQFRPQRWTADLRREHPLGSARLFPFGRGPRACVGAQFAMLVLRASLPALLRTYEFSRGERAATQRYFVGCMLPKRVEWQVHRRSVGRVAPSRATAA